MGSMHFSVSPSDPQADERMPLLKGRAITAFRARAQLTTEALGGSDTGIVNAQPWGSGGATSAVMRSMADEEHGWPWQLPETRPAIARSALCRRHHPKC